MIVLTPANILQDYPKDFVDEGHLEHNPPLFVGAYTHSDLITNVDDVPPALPHFEDGVTLATESLPRLTSGLPLIYAPLSFGSGLEDFQWVNSLNCCKLIMIVLHGHAMRCLAFSLRCRLVVRSNMIVVK